MSVPLYTVVENFSFVQNVCFVGLLILVLYNQYRIRKIQNAISNDDAGDHSGDILGIQDE